MVRTNSLLGKTNLREIKHNWPQFLAVILIAALAVSLFTGLTASYLTLEKRLNYLHEETNMLDVMLLASKIDDDDLNYFSELEYVQSVEKRLSTSAIIEDKVCNVLLTEGIPKISMPYTKELGRGVYVSKYFADSNNLKKGDTVKIETASLSYKMINLFTNKDEIIGMLNGMVKDSGRNILLDEKMILDFTITDVVEHPESVQKGSLSVGIVSIDYETFFERYEEAISFNYKDDYIPLICNIIRENKLYNELIFKTNDRELLLLEINEYCARKDISIITLQTQDKISSNQAVLSDIEQGRKLTYVFPVIFFLVSVLVILTTTSQLIYREKMNIGTMKSIGVSKIKILWHYSSFSMILCLIGGVIGGIVGPLLIPSVMGVKYDILYVLPKVNNVFPFVTTILVIVLLMLLASLVSLIVSYHEVSLNPVESIKGSNDIKYTYHKSFFSKASWSTKIAFRNIARKKARSIMVVVGLLGCTALFLTGFGIKNTLDHSVDEEIYTNFPFSILVTYENDSKNAYQDIESLDVYIEEYAILKAKIEKDNLKDTNIYFIKENSEVFGQELNSEGAIITSKVAELVNAKENDKIKIIVDNRKYEVKVVGIFDSAITQGIFLPQSMKKVIESELDITINMTNAWVKTDKDLELLTERVKEVEGVLNALSIDEYKAHANDVIGGIRVITITLQIFAALLAVVVLYNLAHLNFKERSRDIATMKVLGLSEVEIGKSLIIEMMVLTFIGAFIGLFFGMPILVLLLSINENELISFIYRINPSSYFYSFLLTTITSLVVNLYLGKKIKKVKMVESLKSIE